MRTYPSKVDFSGGRIWIGLSILGLAAILTFARLGHYALWDDEAITALSAIGVWRTGDTVAVVDHNVVAYRSGAVIRNLRHRETPPLPEYLAAPFIGLTGNRSLPARLPFAIVAMICIAILVWWLWNDQASLLTWGLFGIALLCNVSLFLYFRQARYYSPTILASVAMAYLYIHWDGRRRPLIAFAAFSLILWGSNYLNYAALYCCLAADHVLWSRKRQPLRRRDWLALWLPQVAIGVPLFLIWNPLLLDPFFQYKPQDILTEKLTLLWRNLRDLDQCEFGVSLLLLLAPVLYVVVRDLWLLRGTLALLIYILAMTLFSPQPVGQTVAADMRYLAPLIPLSIFLGTVVVRTISRGKWWFALPLAVVAFGTNVLQFYPYYTGEFRSTIALYARELFDPPNDPYKEAAKWINAHVQERQSIWVLPGYMTYPLMYHASKAIYAWQLRDPPEPQFQGLDPIHFRGVAPPDYVIAFGPVVRDVREFLRGGEAAGIEYASIETLDIYWKDLYRPELIWRTFEPITDFDRNLEAIYVFKRVSPPVL